MLTKDQLRELADAGVESITIVVDDAVAYAASLEPEITFRYGAITENVSLVTVDGVHCMSRAMSGSGWLVISKEPYRHLSVYVRSPAKVVPIVVTQAA